MAKQNLDPLYNDKKPDMKKSFNSVVHACIKVKVRSRRVVWSSLNTLNTCVI